MAVTLSVLCKYDIFNGQFLSLCHKRRYKTGVVHSLKTSVYNQQFKNIKYKELWHT